MNNYKILHTISSLDISGGGPSKSVSDLALHQAMQGETIFVITKKSDNPYPQKSSHPNLKFHFAKKLNTTTLKQLLNKVPVDILHGHGIWQLPVHQMARAARRKGIPYIITPRGMLEPWSLKQSKWKKKLALSLYQDKDLRHAACIHTTAPMEAEHIRKLGYTNPIAVIPNGIDLTEFPNQEKKLKTDKRTILFLSRIHPKKGIEVLLEAWEKLDLELRRNWKVEIAGNGEKTYITSLQKKIERKGLEKEILIIGPKFGEEKLLAYGRADLFVLPTYSENFGIVVAEALACGIPVITTEGTPWEELNSREAGWWIQIGVEPLAQTLENVLRLGHQQLQIKGRNGRQLIEEKYSIQAVAADMLKLYEWIVLKKQKPEFIQT